MWRHCTDTSSGLLLVFFFPPVFSFSLLAERERCGWNNIGSCLCALVVRGRGERRWNLIRVTSCGLSVLFYHTSPSLFEVFFFPPDFSFFEPPFLSFAIRGKESSRFRTQVSNLSKGHFARAWVQGCAPAQFERLFRVSGWMKVPLAKPG